MRILLPLVYCLLAATCAAPGTGAAPARRAPAGSIGPRAESGRLERVRAALEAERRRLRIPGLAVAVVEDDRVVLLAGLGVRDLKTREPVDTGTVFPIGSCTKAFTSMLVMMSQADGRLSLDDSPHSTLPWFHMDDPEANRLVTLRDMLSHRTGLKGYADLAAEPGVLSREQYLRAATAARPVARLREKFQYSNAMFVAAGEIAARAQGTTWEQAIERRILGPLGMSSSRVSLDGISRLADHATGYEDPLGTGTWSPVGPPASMDALAPAGAIASTAPDMARWVRFLLARGAIDGTRLLPEAAVDELMTPHTQIRGALWYALGWATYDWNGHRVVEHNGGSAGISALVSLMPERRIGFVLLGNTTPTSLTKVTEAGKILWPLLLGERASPADSGRPAAASTAPAADSAAVDTLDRPAPAELLRRMLAAAGGARNLARHRSAEMRLRRTYWNQGVAADVRVLWQAPDRLDTEETWTAAGRRIGRVRSYCDGARAGQETTFGQDAIYAGDELAGARRKAMLAWLAEPAKVFPSCTVLGRTRVAGEDAYLLRLSPPSGEPMTCAVSARTSLIVRKTTGDTAESYSDFRDVSGVVRPFRTVIVDGLGESELVVREIRFDLALPAAAFAPRRGAPRTAAPGGATIP